MGEVAADLEAVVARASTQKGRQSGPIDDDGVVAVGTLDGSGIAVDGCGCNGISDVNRIAAKATEEGVGVAFCFEVERVDSLADHHLSTVPGILHSLIDQVKTNY